MSKEQIIIKGVAAQLALKPGIECIVVANSPDELRQALEGYEIGDICHTIVTPGPRVVEGPTIEGFAKQLNGREYRQEVTPAEDIALKAAGMVAVFGYSDDGTEFRGAIRDEVSSYGGGTLRFSKKGKFFDEDAMTALKSLVDDGTIEKMPEILEIKAVWSDTDGPSWTYETEIPHATFDVMEGESVFCRAIVFRLPQ